MQIYWAFTCQEEDFLAIQKEIQNARIYSPPILFTVEDTQWLLAVPHEKKYPSLPFLLHLRLLPGFPICWTQSEGSSFWTSWAPETQLEEPCAGMQSRACEKTERHRLKLRASRPGPGASAWPERGSGFPGASVPENPPADPGGPGHAGEVDSIPASGISPGGGNGNPLQYSCLENPMDRGAWRVIVHWGRKSRTWLSNWTHTKRGSGQAHYPEWVHAEGKQSPRDLKIQVCPK